MKKFLAVALSCALFVTAFMGLSMTASAEGTPVEFTAQSVEAKPGDIITIDISVSENHYMVNGQIQIDYDPASLEIQTVWDDEDNPYFEDINTKIFKSSYMWAFAVPVAGTAKFAFATSSAKGTTVGGVMFTLTFKVLEGATTSDIVVSIPDDDMCANDGTSNAGEDYVVDATFVKGVVTVESDEPALLPGDIDGNGTVAIADAMKVFYHVNGKRDMTDEEYARADVTGDGAVGIADAMRLFYYINNKIENL